MSDELLEAYHARQRANELENRDHARFTKASEALRLRPNKRTVVLPMDRDARNTLIGIMLKAERKAKGWTQPQLAERLEVSVPYLCHVEAGRKALSLDTLMAACEVLGWKLEIRP